MKSCKASSSGSLQWPACRALTLWSRPGAGKSLQASQLSFTSKTCWVWRTRSLCHFEPSAEPWESHLGPRPGFVLGTQTLRRVAQGKQIPRRQCKSEACYYHLEWGRSFHWLCPLSRTASVYSHCQEKVLKEPELRVEENIYSRSIFSVQAEEETPPMAIF